MLTFMCNKRNAAVPHPEVCERQCVCVCGVHVSLDIENLMEGWFSTLPTLSRIFFSHIFSVGTMVFFINNVIV